MPWVVLRLLPLAPLLPLLSTGSCVPPTTPIEPPTAEQACAAATWVVTGFGPEDLEVPRPDALWRATIRRGETVPLVLSVLNASPPDQCQALVSGSTWVSTALEVAEVVADGRLGAHLVGRATGETIVLATVTLSTGVSSRAETWATPPNGTRLLRVYGVVVR